MRYSVKPGDEPVEFDRFPRGAEAAIAAWRIATGRCRVERSLPLNVVRHRQRGRCFLCGVALRGLSESWLTRESRDHVFPRAQRGDARANLLLAHQSCNSGKADRWPYPCEVIYLAAVYAAPVKRRAA